MEEELLQAKRLQKRIIFCRYGKVSEEALKKIGLEGKQGIQFESKEELIRKTEDLFDSIPPIHSQISEDMKMGRRPQSDTIVIDNTLSSKQYLLNTPKPWDPPISKHTYTCIFYGMKLKYEGELVHHISLCVSES